MDKDVISEGEEEGDDDLLLTRSEATLRPNEFEKRIADIKSKLVEIKNSINNEIDVSMEKTQQEVSFAQESQVMHTSIEHFQHRLKSIKANLQQSANGKSHKQVDYTLNSNLEESCSNAFKEQS